MNNEFNKKINQGNCSSPATSRMCTCTDVYSILRAGNCASALHIHVKQILGDWQRSPNGKLLAVLFFPPMVSWVVDRHHGLLVSVGCCPYTRLEDCVENLRCLSKLGEFSSRPLLSFLLERRSRFLP